MNLLKAELLRKNMIVGDRIGFKLAKRFIANTWLFLIVICTLHGCGPKPRKSMTVLKSLRNSPIVIKSKDFGKIFPTDGNKNQDQLEFIFSGNYYYIQKGFIERKSPIAVEGLHFIALAGGGRLGYIESNEHSVLSRLEHLINLLSIELKKRNIVPLRYNVSKSSTKDFSQAGFVTNLGMVFLSSQKLENGTQTIDWSYCLMEGDANFREGEITEFEGGSPFKPNLDRWSD